jgi:hypothetical protein
MIHAGRALDSTQGTRIVELGYGVVYLPLDRASLTDLN